MICCVGGLPLASGRDHLLTHILGVPLRMRRSNSVTCCVKLAGRSEEWDNMAIYHATAVACAKFEHVSLKI